jgi:sulfur-carrier protein
MIKVTLPYHLRNLAGIDGDVDLDVQGPATIGDVINALEGRYPNLTGTIRDHYTQKRRPWLRFFAVKEDISHEGLDAPLPKEVLSGEEPLMIVGAIAGG